MSEARDKKTTTPPEEKSMIKPHKRYASLPEKTAVWKYRFLLVWAVIGTLFVISVAFLGFSRIAGALLPLFLALLLWYILKGVVDFLERKKVPRVLGTIVAFILFALVWVALSLIVFPVIGRQVTELIHQFPTYVNQASDWVTNLVDQYRQLEPSSTLKELIDNATKQLVGWASNLATSSGSYIISGASSAVGFIVSIFMSFILAFWLLKDGKRIGKEIRILVSDRWRGDFNFFVDTVGHSVGGYIKGTLISSACTGALATIGFYAIGLPYALILGILTGMLNVIPVIGPWIGGVIAAIVGLFVSPVTAILSIVITIAAQQITDSFISPRVMSANVNLHPIMVIIALLLGSALGGILGTIIAVPILAVIKGIFVYYFENKTGKTLATQDGALFPEGRPRKPKKVEKPKESEE